MENNINDKKTTYLNNWLNATPEFVFFKDTKGIYKLISSSILNLTKFENIDDVIGKTDGEIYPPDVAKKFLEEDRIIFETQINYICEDWVTHKHLGKILIETLKIPIFDENENLIGIQGISRNVTDKHQLQKKIMQRDSELRAILRTLPSMVWIKDVHGKYLETNQKYREYFGVSDKNITGEGVYNTLYMNDLTDTDIIKKLKELDDTVIQEHKTVKILMPVYVNNEKRWAEIVKSPLLLDDGTFYGILGVGTDVTEYKNYHELMKNAKDKAVEASKLKSEFVANVSHEIRTPMNGIMGFVQLLQGTELNDEQKDYVEEIMKSSESLLKLLNDVLDLSKAQAGKMTLEEVPFNLRSIVEDVATLASSSLKGKNIDILNYIDTNIVENLIGDGEKLKQVLNNFVNNAVKFTEKGQIHINAKFQNVTEDELEVLFEIQDTGVGIKEENLGKIFESFTQADASTTRKYGGTGLGLSISKNIIEQMKGQVHVESTFNVGTKFSFNAFFKIDREKLSENELEMPDWTDKRIFVIDDSSYRLAICRNYLKSSKITIIDAQSAQKAIEMLDCDNKFNAIIVNYRSENNSGLEIVNKIKSANHLKDIPLILAIGRFENQVFEQKEKCNVEKFLLEPVKRKDLLYTLMCVFGD